MQKDRQTVHDQVLEAYDLVYGFRPDEPADVALGEDLDAAALLEKLRGTLGIEAGTEVPEGTLDDLIDYLHERWDGVTLDALEGD
jgi:hypothetical protein